MNQQIREEILKKLKENGINIPVCLQEEFDREAIILGTLGQNFSWESTRLNSSSLFGPPSVKTSGTTVLNGAVKATEEVVECIDIVYAANGIMSSRQGGLDGPNTSSPNAPRKI